MITVGSIVTPRVPIRAFMKDRPWEDDWSDAPELYAQIYSKSITPGERFGVVSTDGVEAIIEPITGGEDFTVSCSDLELWG